jgi:hypothetical protein
MKKLMIALRVCSIVLGLPVVAPFQASAADRDSNADAAARTVSTSEGVILRVPIDARGNENTDAAELRSLGIGNSVGPDGLAKAWDSAIEMQPETIAPADSSSDSSTAWWGWNRWNGYGWRSPYYYYNSYTPRFNYYGNYYNYYGYSYPTYSYPYYWNSYAPYGNYYGYRYYYYPRYY